ncbi:MAG TPA: ATP-dependent zinc metalloprotease FtsH [Anaerolineae bacterium]|mgnify:CR=1 FL=1|nr:ATP-dependent zinc metalloprotease FtsH [Anaerolineae bacterium]HQK15161.1 ATP-dependent zinc metalloprotease FtsH [Anaerolineae bacterium]
MKSKQGNSNFVYLLVVAAVLFLIYSYLGGGTEQPTVPLNKIADDIEAGKITSISVRGDILQVTYKEPTGTGEQIVLSRKGRESSLVEQLHALGVSETTLRQVTIEFKEPTDWSTLVNLGLTLLGMIVLSVVIIIVFRQVQGANNQALSFGKSRARMFSGDRPTITFDDVAGIEESKEELKEIVEFLKEPQKFINLGARIPKGVLLIGSPGTGKTLLAKAVAGQAGVPFFSISGSEFVEMFVGVGASRVRDLFDQAKRHSPCIVFVDEIDAVGRYRGAGLGGSHDEREQTLNQILVEMDGFDTDTNVIVVAATNRPDILDPALLRPGRFDRRVILDQPDIRGREAIFRVHTRGKPIAAEVDLEELAQSTPGFVGADIENVVNEAAILAARRGLRRIGMSEFNEAIERVIAGPERHSRLISQEELRVFAYHEVGHAVVAHVLPKCDPVRKISIVARGMAGGYTIALPEADRYVLQRSKIEDDIAYGLGGRAAEEIVFNEVSTGAASDLETVTKMARAMVTRYGMSDTLGPLVYGRKEELVFLGKEIGEQRDYSEAIAHQIDDEVRKIVTQAYERAKTVIQEHREQMDRIVNYLMERETLSAEEFVAAFEGRPLPKRAEKPKPSPTSEAEPVLKAAPVAA